jgi:hypothetical protein
MKWVKISFWLFVAVVHFASVIFVDYRAESWREVCFSLAIGCMSLLLAMLYYEVKEQR